jgi:membrane associated rhomboid family serine protease
MSFLTPIACSTRCMSRVGAGSCRSLFIPPKQHVNFKLHVRLKSESARPPPPKSAASAGKPTGSDDATVRGKLNPETSSVKKASLILGSLRKPGQSPGTRQHVRSAKGASSGPVHDALTPINQNQGLARIKNLKLPKKRELEESKTTQISEGELIDQGRVAEKRKQVLWPGIWTLLALAGTYSILAYLDVKAGIPSSDGSDLPTRVQLPQTWYLTPEVIRKGLVTGWREFDSLTIGLAVASMAMHVLTRSTPPIWRKLIHVTGKAKWTAFTYPLVHSSWTHLALNMAALVWFLPGVVHYFDGDLFHTSAFLISVPLTTSYLTHFAYRFNLIQASFLNVGASGAIFAAFGVYCMAYAKEKMWVPAGLVLRLDAREWSLLFVLHQAYNMTRASKSGSRPAFMVCCTSLGCGCLANFAQIHLISFALGLAYAHFNMKHHLWIPLVSEISSTQDSNNEAGE